MKKTISILVENQAGVLNRITSLFSRRAFNIESLAVGVTDDPTILHRMRQQAAQALIRESAARFRAMGLSMEQAAAMLLALEQEEQNG